MREMNTSLWDLTRDSKIERHFDRLRKEMLPDDALASAKLKKIVHAAVGRSLKLTAKPSPSYFGGGAKSLTDGWIGAADHTSGQWLGFHGDDLEAVIDLGKSQPVRQIAARFLRSIGVGIYLPAEVEFAVSEDGHDYQTVVKARAATTGSGAGPLAKIIKADNLEVRARYVRVRASNVAVIPEGHRAAGRKAWLFADEIMVNPAPSEDSRNEDHP